VAWKSFPQVRVQDVEVLILLAALFLPSVALASQQSFGALELMLSASVPYRHLGSLSFIFKITAKM
jgi:hypothetical protein